MTSKYDNVLGIVQGGLIGQSKKTSIELRKIVQDTAKIYAPELGASELEKIARDIEVNQGIKAGFESVVDSSNFKPWLDDAKSDIDPFYWNRYHKLLKVKGLPSDVVISIDRVTEKILDRLGNPKLSSQWDRRGMVVGQVQSGKTANYTGLICKAADAGYRLIIVIAGLSNNLRNQTQARIDEGFIGRDTGKSNRGLFGSYKHVIGVGEFNNRNTPVSLTNTLKDFNSETANTNTSEIDSYNVPVVLVVKKNHNTLGNLIGWLRDNSARGNNEMIDQPMLLIDDEADNASINTKYSKDDTTKINGQIRDLLNMFHRSCYIGYTATPFANIFIDPDNNDEMFEEDLFPRDFIIGLDAPSNYFGPTKIFEEGLPDSEEPTWIRYITDNEDILPIKHKIDHVVDELPNSLIEALRAFLLTRTIRNLRGQKDQHCSMLVNASRFNDLQRQVRNRLHESLEQIKNSVRIKASLQDKALRDPEIAKLQEVWVREFSNIEFDWYQIQDELHDAIASAKIVEVNHLANELDYSASVDRGQTVVVIGGFSLSRGLTLEGLTISWFLRNSMMYDTLMQMGRWFGYRNKYEDLCRIWMAPESAEWYAFIAEASEELYDELRKMEQAKATPNMYGLEIRNHPASLMVTARNKMGAGQKIITQVGLSNKFVETAKISINKQYLDSNMLLAKKLISKLDHGDFSKENTKWGTLVREVPVGLIDDFLVGWLNAKESIITEPEPIRKYINDRQHDELKLWDVLIPSLIKGEPDYSLGWQIKPINRAVGLPDLRHGFMSISGKRMRVASRGLEEAGVDIEKVSEAKELYLKDPKNNKFDGSNKVNFPDRIFRRVRERGLFILYLINAKAPKGKEWHSETDLIPPTPFIAWGISLPESSYKKRQVEYVVNPIRYKEIFGPEDIDENEEL